MPTLINKETKNDLKDLIDILLKERKDKDLSEKCEKCKQILLLLAKGTMLATMLIAPGTARLFKKFAKDKSGWNEWKIFNTNYLRRTIRRMERDQIIEIEEKNGEGVVKITENGWKKVLQYSLEEIMLSRPAVWDYKWRLVFYDISHSQKSTRDKFRNYMQSLGFYPLQKSVYLHAYPCEKEIEFLRSYLGVHGEVRLAIVDKIENDRQFREYFSV